MTAIARELDEKLRTLDANTAAFVERLDSYVLSRTKLLQVVFESAIVQHSWQGLNSRDFVSRLHRALLSREAEPGEIAHWQTLLDSGRPRRSIIRMFATGEELARYRGFMNPASCAAMFGQGQRPAR